MKKPKKPKELPVENQTAQLAKVMADITPEDFNKELEGLFAAMMKRADEERKKSQPWKDLWAASEKGLQALLSDASEKMSDIVDDTIAVIRERFGAQFTPDKPSTAIYNLIRAIPYVMPKLKSGIREEHGFSCCADKAREVYYQAVLAEIKKLAE